jgi:hypothetical protein
MPAVPFEADVPAAEKKAARLPQLRPRIRDGDEAMTKHFLGGLLIGIALGAGAAAGWAQARIVGVRANQAAAVQAATADLKSQIAQLHAQVDRDVQDFNAQSGQLAATQADMAAANTELAAWRTAVPHTSTPDDLKARMQIIAQNQSQGWQAAQGVLVQLNACRLASRQLVAQAQQQPGQVSPQTLAIITTLAKVLLH